MSSDAARGCSRTLRPTMPPPPVRRTRVFTAKIVTNRPPPGPSVGEAAFLLPVGVHHQLDELMERDLVLPSELDPRLGRVADEQVHLGGAEVVRIDRDDRLSRLA